MPITSSIALCLSIVTADPEVGDKVVTLTTAPVMSGSEKLAEVEPGVELTVTSVKRPWVGVTVTQNGKEVKGWVLDKNLVLGPEIAFARLVVGHFHDVRNSRKKIEKANGRFKSMDTNGDSVLTLREFRDGAKVPPLDELNRRLQQTMVGFARGNPDEQRIVRAAGGLDGQLGLAILDFRGWIRSPRYDENTQLARFFQKTRDIRKSPLAQQLLEREDVNERSRRANSLFAWVDKDRDSQLSIDEFRQPFENANAAKPNPSPSTGKGETRQLTHK